MFANCSIAAQLWPQVNATSAGVARNQRATESAAFVDSQAERTLEQFATFFLFFELASADVTYR